MQLQTAGALSPGPTPSQDRVGSQLHEGEEVAAALLTAARLSVNPLRAWG